MRTPRQCGHARRRLPIQIVALSVTTIPPLPTLFVDLLYVLFLLARDPGSNPLYTCVVSIKYRAHKRDIRFNFLK